MKKYLIIDHHSPANKTLQLGLSEFADIVINSKDAKEIKRQMTAEHGGFKKSNRTKRG